jgi:TonB family protein
MTRRAAIAILLFTCCASVTAQEQNGKIVFYRESHFMDFDYKSLLFCDGFELARMVNGGYLEVAAQPGRHECVAESAQGPATMIEIVPGGIAYLRVAITPTVKRHAVLTASNEEEFRRHKKLARIATAESDSVQPLAPAVPPPPIAGTSPDSRELSAKVAEPEVVFHPGVDGVTYPKCIYCTDPKYTPQARHAKINGTVELTAIVGVDGKAHNTEIVKALGQGLDEQAVIAIQSWRFQPAVGPNGEPVAVVVPIQVTFRVVK